MEQTQPTPETIQPQPPTNPVEQTTEPFEPPPSEPVATERLFLQIIPDCWQPNGV